MNSINPLNDGADAPAFSFRDSSGTVSSSGDLAGKPYLVYFYPKDNTPGCTIEAKKFSDALPEFEKQGAVVIGISGGDQKSKTKFCDKHDLKLLLLSDDADFSASKSFACYGKKKFMGREFDGILRTTFIIGKDGRLKAVMNKVKTKSHHDDVLAIIDGLE